MTKKELAKNIEYAARFYLEYKSGSYETIYFIFHKEHKAVAACENGYTDKNEIFLFKSDLEKDLHMACNNNIDKYIDWLTTNKINYINL